MSDTPCVATFPSMLAIDGVQVCAGRAGHAGPHYHEFRGLRVEWGVMAPSPPGFGVGGESAGRTTALPDLVTLIRQAEWAGPTDGNGPSTCPWCGKPEHAPTCPVAPILYPKEQA